MATDKGAKQRLVPMSPRLLAALRNYCHEYRVPTYLFPGRDHDTPISGTTMQKALKAAAREAGLSPQISPHTLRHSFATGLLEAGVDLLAIGELSGAQEFHDDDDLLARPSATLAIDAESNRLAAGAAMSALAGRHDPASERRRVRASLVAAHLAARLHEGASLGRR